MKRSILKVIDCALSVWRLGTLKNVAPDEEPVVECFVPPTPWGRQGSLLDEEARKPAHLKQL